MSQKMRMNLFLVFLGVFALWLAALIFYIFPTLVAHINDGTFDVLMGIVAGIGVGGITQFFIMALTLSWQFYWRKSPEGEQAKG